MTVETMLGVMEKFGWPAIMVTLVMYFFYGKVWPLLVKQLVFHQESSKESQASFMLALERRDLALDRQTEAMAAAQGDQNRILSEQTRVLASIQSEIVQFRRAAEQA